MSYRSYLAVSSVKSYIRNLAKAVFKPRNDVRVSIDKVLDKMVADGAIGTLLQVGANDGVKNDPVRPLIARGKVRAILVEPFLENFRKLCKNYEGMSGSLAFEQVGIGDKETELDFYYISDIRDDEPDWYDQVGSFDKETFLSNISVVPGLKERVAVRKVPCTTIQAILNRHQLETVDFIHLDTEGYDYKILQTIDFGKLRVKAILFETDWMKLFELRMTRKMLEGAGYDLFFEGIDCLALRR